MNDSTESTIAIEAGYLACRRMTRRSGSNFYPCFFVLPRAKRRAMDALYAFMRHTDDLADSADPLEDRRRGVERWRESLEAALAGDLPSPETPEPQHGRLEHPADATGRAILPAVADTVRRFGIPADHLEAVIDGVEMDLGRRQYETFAELAEYCHRVASAVGLACIHVWGVHGDQAPGLARQCGLAFQMTNILRDLKEDAARGRVYLPDEDLRACGYSAEDLTAGVADERFGRLMELEIGRVRECYHAGADLIDCLLPEGRRIFGMMVSVYHGLLEEIARRPTEVLRRRVRLGRPRKLAIAARWFLLPPRRSALP